MLNCRTKTAILIARFYQLVKSETVDVAGRKPKRFSEAKEPSAKRHQVEPTPPSENPWDIETRRPRLQLSPEEAISMRASDFEKLLGRHIEVMVEMRLKVASIQDRLDRGIRSTKHRVELERSLTCDIKACTLRLVSLTSTVVAFEEEWNGRVEVIDD